jgi:hypothetical protein
MVHVVFDVNQIAYDDFIQTGRGGSDNYENPYPYFRGTPVFQRGYGIQGGAGIGNILRGLWRFFLPVLKKVGTTVSEEALDTGRRVLEKVNQGEGLKQAVVSEGKKGVDNVLDKGGFPKQFGGGRRRRTKKRLPKRAPASNHQIVIGQSITKPIAHSKKKLRSDAFGLY